MTKFSIDQQIEEVEREISLREGVYARQVASGKMRQAIADYHMGRMRAAKATLEFVRDHQDEIKKATTKEADG